MRSCTTRARMRVRAVERENVSPHYETANVYAKHGCLTASARFWRPCCPYGHPRVASIHPNSVRMRKTFSSHRPAMFSAIIRKRACARVNTYSSHMCVCVSAANNTDIHTQCVVRTTALTSFRFHRSTYVYVRSALFSVHGIYCNRLYSRIHLLQSRYA